MTSHLTRVRTRLRLHAQRPVSGRLEGDYRSLQAGRSHDFADLRGYVRGDDVKDLDWKASARTRSLLVRRYDAQRTLNVQLVVSTGRSMAAMCTPTESKRDVTVMAIGIVGDVAARHGDLVGLVHGDAAGCHLVPPGVGEIRLERCLARVHDAISEEGGRSDLLGLLRHTARTVKGRALMLVVCDDPVLGPDVTAALRRLVVQHEVLLLTIGDLEPTAVAPGTPLRDVDTAAPLPDWLRVDPELAGQHRALVAAQIAARTMQVEALGIVAQHVPDEASALPAVARLLERHRRARRG